MLQSGRPTEVNSDQIETLIENNQQHYTMQEIGNTLKISKSIMLVKMKNVFFILRKKHTNFLVNPICQYLHIYIYTISILYTYTYT